MANVQGTFYRGETQRSGVTPTSPPNAGDDPVGPLNPPGSGNTTTYKQLGDTTDKSFVGKNGFVPVVVGENQLTLQPLPNADQDGLISGGIVQWTGTDYDFNVSAALARFQGVFPLNSVADILSLTTPDATNDRIDLFILQILFDGSGIPNGMEADFITGTPAASPIKPQINPATQIELTSVLVTAGSTTPTLTEEVIYDENTEWTGTTSGTGTGVFNSAVDPYQGTVSVETTNIQNGFQVQFNNGSEIDISTYQTFGFQINLKASLGANQNLYVTFLNGSLDPVSNFVLINLNKSLTGYQFIGIALNSVNFTSFDVQYIRFSFVRTSGPTTFAGYFLDIVKLEGGIAPPVTQNTFLNLTDTPSTYLGQANKVVSVKADETGLEFTTASGGASTFLALTDTPSTYASQANKWTRVNGAENALIFDTVSPYDLDQEGATDGQVLTWSTANSRYQPVTPSGGGISGLTTNRIPVATSATTIGNSNITQNSTTDFIFGNTTTSLTATPLKVSLGGTVGNNTIGSSANLKFVLFDNGVANDRYGIGMSANLMELRAGASAAIGFFTNNGVEAMRILSSQNVVIGATTSSDKFRVVGNVSFGSGYSYNNTTQVTTITGLNSGVQSPLYITAGGTATRVAVNHSSNSGIGFYILNSIKWSIAAFNSTFDFVVYNDSLARTHVYCHGSTNNMAIGSFGIGALADSGFRLDVHGTLRVQGSTTFTDASNIVLATTTGTKIGTATTQKLAFWNKTPIIQPTTGITGATLVGGGGTTITDTDTFGGYTLQQIAAVLINTGLMA